MPDESDCLLLAPDGTRVSVDTRGVLVGRAASAGILLADPTASRRHALVYLDAAGPQLVPLGRLPVRVNGEPTHGPTPLADGDVLGFPGMELRVQRRATTPRGCKGWVLRLMDAPDLSSDLFIRLPEAAFSLGGAEGDAVRLQGWPDAAVRFEPAFPAGWRAFLARGITWNGTTASPDRAVDVRSGDRFASGRRVVRVLDLSQAGCTTVGEEDESLPFHVELRPLPPAGGQVTVHTRAWVRTAFIPGLRWDLLALLLQPPPGKPGEFPRPPAPGDGLPDTYLAPRIWGRQIPSDPKAVTVLTKRLRQDLESGGIDGHSLLFRDRGRTWFALMRDAVVEVTD